MRLPFYIPWNRQVVLTEELVVPPFQLENEARDELFTEVDLDLFTEVIQEVSLRNPTPI